MGPVIASLAGLLLAAGCGSSGSTPATDAGPGSDASGCTPYATSDCANGNLYWVDSCGVRGELALECTGGSECSEDLGGCCNPDGEGAEQCTTPDQPPARCGHDFDDVSPDGIAHDAIRAVYVNEVIDACADDPLRFCGADAVTRSELATMLIRGMGEAPSTAADDAYFCDISGHATDDINRLYELDVTSGCNSAPPCADTDQLTFCPGDPVKRFQLAIFLVRALGESPSAAADDAYFDDIGGIAAPYINRLYELDLTVGCDTRLFCPGDDLHRAATALFLSGAFELDDSACP